ncbi:unnamed protein product [Candidula unifasciata]|uniref:KASH domain-containing protein n=1 Tax=Candidula unifasciata TaxID=100452 RepID=A0A8S3ZCQ9_9EUPU|nr:unnamed protein product [Candidula unifasciata]
MLYPTASEDTGEELMTWEQQDDLEFEDDFLLRHQKESLVKNGMISVHKHAELSISQQNLLVEDSDSELEDFHHILDQSELALKKAEQSLSKMRNQPVSPGHVNSVKYDEIIKMYETNMGCLRSICQHLKSENVPENDVKRVQALMCQWEELHNLATEYQTCAKFLSDMAAVIVEAQTHIQEVENCGPFDGLTKAEELKKVITSLEERKSGLKQQEQLLNISYKQLLEFSGRHPVKHAEGCLQELPGIQKAIAAAINKVSDHLKGQTEWLEYFERQHRLNVSLTTDREKLHKLLCQQQFRMQVSKQDVMKELEVLHNNLSLYESELSLLQSMRPQLAKNSDPLAKSLLASIGDLRYQLLVMSQRCCQIDHYIEDSDDTLLHQHSDLGKLAVYSTTLHETTTIPKDSLSRSSSLENLPATSSTNNKNTGSCASWLCSLPAQVVALMLVTGLICALDPDILDHLTNLTLKISPELRYVNGPPAT